MVTRRRYGISALLLSALCAVALAGCEQDNDIVAQRQLMESRQSCPKGCEQAIPNCEIKGNISVQGNKFFHVPGGRYYDGIEIQADKGERWFCTEAEAIDNGWRKSSE
jgi:hypothetical protein